MLRTTELWLSSAIAFLSLFTSTNSGIYGPKGNSDCGYHLREPHGIIQTPGFPRRFDVPFRCSWVIDKSGYEANASIVVYLTQLYVTTGITFSEYVDDSYSYMTRSMGITSDNVTKTGSLTSNGTYLRIDFEMYQLEGNHVRFLDDANNVYYMFGFNITYKIVTKSSDELNSRCNAGAFCSLLGNCYTSADFRRNECQCFSHYSGPSCQYGPMCPGHKCLNNGSCKQLSSVAVGCDCMPGFRGSRCEIDDNYESIPQQQCSINSESSPCKCRNPQAIPSGSLRYDTVLQLNEYSKKALSINATYAEIQHFLAKKLRGSRDDRPYKLYNFSISRDGKVSFQFFSNETNGNRTFNLLDDEYYGNFTFISTRPHPALQLIEIHVRKSQILIRDELQVSCSAYGSVNMTFTWFKDEAYINETLSQRSITLPLIETSAFHRKYQSTVIIPHASALDQGQYTCRVVDYHVEQCASIYVQVIGPPKVRLTPMSVSIAKGENLDLLCLPEDAVPSDFAYTWGNERGLLASVPGKQVSEDIYLSHNNQSVAMGSVLQITNIQKSTTYTCQVNVAKAKTVKQTRVEVYDEKTRTLCKGVSGEGVRWPYTVANSDAIVDCPSQIGYARRQCLKTFNSSKWQTPDFSNCTIPEVQDLAENFSRLTLGYQVTSIPETLDKLLTVVSYSRYLRPGEAAQFLTFLDAIQNYLNHPTQSVHIQTSVQYFFYILDILLGFDQAILLDEQIQLTQRLIKNQISAWGVHISGPGFKSARNITNMAIGSVFLNSTYKTHSFKFPHLSWMTDKAAVTLVTVEDQDIDSNLTIVLTVYKNFTKFLPQRYLLKLDNGTDFFYEVNSRIVTVEVISKRHTRHGSHPPFQILLEFEPVMKTLDANLWNLACASTDIASLRPSWKVNVLPNNTTDCLFRGPGTYALVIASKAPQDTSRQSSKVPVPVLIGCICCLVQNLLTLGMLIPNWIRHHTCLLFLKIQSCLTVSGAAVVFIYSVQDAIPQEVYPAVATLLEMLLLLPLTAQLSKLLIVYTEIVQVPIVRHMKQTVVCIMTGAPVLAVLTNLLFHHSIGWSPRVWWLVPGSPTFTIFISSALVTCFLYVFLHANVMRKLKILSLRNSDKSRGVVKRLGLVKRSGLIYMALVFTESASILYFNVRDITSQYIFGSSSALLGSVMLICYAIKSESPPYIRLLNKLKMDPTTPDDFSSDSGITPLSFFTKQDGEIESEGAAPRIHVRGRDLLADQDVAEQLLMEDSRRPEPRRPRDEAGTLETFVYSASSDFPTHPISPSRYKPMTSFKIQDNSGFGEYVEQDNNPIVKPINVPSYILDTGGTCKDIPSCSSSFSKDCKEPSVGSTHTEMITTRVCVELGVITTHQRNEVTGIEEDAPAIVLCSVDVEPCQSRVVEVPEALCCSSVGTASSFVLGITGPETESLVCSDPLPALLDSLPENSLPPPPPFLAETNGYTTKEQPNNEEDQKPQQEKIKPKTDNMEGMLDRISLDLDYLLNRKAQKKMAGNLKGVVFEEKDEEDTSLGPVDYLSKC